jgi:rfaE bifunctional protein kinase chain/domain
MNKNFLNKYSFKVLNKKEILKTLNKLRKEKKKIILCHGNFDVVHPGHVRHLIYAKSKADILIVSITADQFINKGLYRPHVPEKIRALNLAAFEAVDYVIIDKHKNSIPIINFIKPNFFAKGFEYQKNKTMPEATKEEFNLMKKIKGEMIFTPGDVVYSSTKFINSYAPDIKMEKLMSLMETNNLNFEKIKNIINSFSKIKIHVIGDTIVDSYTETSLIGGQTKTPTISVLREKNIDYIGGAGVVALNMYHAGAKVSFSTVLGNDKLGSFVKQKLKSKINFFPYIDNSRPTTNKNLIVCNNHRLIKIDTLDNQPITKKIVESILNDISKIKNLNGVVFSDFRHGMFNKSNIDIFVKKLKKNIFKSADSQVASRWGNICDFINFDLITPNEKEARFSVSDQDSGMSLLSNKIIKASKCKNLILKLGSRGVFAVENKPSRNAFHIDSFANSVVDAVGTGDAMLAYSTLAQIASKSLLASTIIGSAAAACKCEKDGNNPISRDDVLRKIIELEKKIET